MREGKLPIPVCCRAHIQRGLRVAQTLPVDPARLRAVCVPCFGSDRRCAQGGRLSHEQGRCADARSGEAGTRYASGRQEARADDRYAARYRQCLTAGASRATRARTATRDPTYGGQPWRTALADGVRAGRRDLARDRRQRAIILLRFDWLIGLIGALLGDLKWRTRASGSCPAGVLPG